MWYRLSLLVLVGLSGCNLLEAQEREEFFCSHPEVVVPPEGQESYALICLGGRPWRPDSALGALDLILDNDERAYHLELSFFLRDPTPALPFYEARLSLRLYEKPLKTDTTYYLFNSNPRERERVANGYPENFLGRMGILSETDWDVYLGAYWIAREDSLRSWVRFSRIDTVQTEPFLLVFYEGSFEVVLSPFSREPAWSRYPNEKLHFAGRFRVPAVTWDYLYRCWQARNCLRVRLRTL
ncbi:hypothetical protein ABUL39_11405 [Rhodothermus marinus]|uniref:hypothetical protein n=1 Tax=Rhodothermus marinus TaxID=29549 RepID=UPI0037CB4DD2